MEQNQTNFYQSLRRRLGIPDDAERVLIFSESSHWDPNWLYTAEEYYERFVRKNLDQAIVELNRKERRIYSVECIFFLRMYWDRNPEQRAQVRNLVNEGRLRLTGSGVTTADTLLPDTEAILRDFLLGQEWLRKNGMKQEPGLAYFTDSFGCTPALPSILKAAGFDRTAITRIDGMYFMACDPELPGRFPRAGSSAEKLLKHEHSLDFIWRDRNGAQVLCHWNAFTYGQGDMLAYKGLSRVYLARLAYPARSDRHVAHRIKQYVSKLSPNSRTPYMLCPIGFDFVEPIPDLIALLDRYNQNHYASTGIWTINAGMDDYLTLVDQYKDELPVLELDPNPYWTGFYTSRPSLKQRSLKLVENLLLAEKMSFLPENIASSEDISNELQDAWWQAVVSNHHDFITGTSPDRVVEEEQIPWLKQAAGSVDAVMDRLSAKGAVTVAVAKDPTSLTWKKEDGRIQIKTSHYHIELDEAAGGAIVNLKSRNLKTEYLSAISNDLVSYKDSGGLWRMGYEFAGGIWKESVCASQHSVQMETEEHDHGLEVKSIIELGGKKFLRRMWFSKDSPLIHCSVTGIAARGHSIIVRFATGLSSQNLEMDTSGGMVMRPPMRYYKPTFWPLHHFAHLRDDESDHGFAILQSCPGAISYDHHGRVELVAMRNATKEKVFGLIGIPGNPASGHEHESYTCEYALLFTEKGDWRENDIHLYSGDILNNPWSKSRDLMIQGLCDSIVTTDSQQVGVRAIKVASRGEGIIVRLYAHTLPESVVNLSVHRYEVTQAYLCDARERNLEALVVQDGVVKVSMLATIASIRLVIADQLF